MYLCSVNINNNNTRKYQIAMKTTFNFRSVVFQRAYRIVKETGCTLSAALVEAWKRYRAYRDSIVADLVERINGFDFYYHRSDDNRVYMNWWNTENRIRKELAALPNFFVAAITGKLNRAENIKTFVNRNIVLDWTKQIKA